MGNVGSSVQQASCEQEQTSIIEEDIPLSSNEDNLNEYSDNMYYLLLNKKKLFICSRVSSCTDSKHNDTAQFAIRTVLGLRRLIHWEKYDPAIHNTGQIITWKLIDTQQCKSKTQIHTQDDTEAMDLTGPQKVEHGRKRKRNDQASLIAQRKVCRNRGLSYSPWKKGGVRQPRKSKRDQASLPSYMQI